MPIDSGGILSGLVLNQDTHLFFADPPLIEPILMLTPDLSLLIYHLMTFRWHRLFIMPDRLSNHYFIRSQSTSLISYLCAVHENFTYYPEFEIYPQ
jgi:hypothetical protein